MILTWLGVSLAFLGVVRMAAGRSRTLFTIGCLTIVGNGTYLTLRYLAGY